jgi:cytoskeletal protein CcmA (bactofilin family)
MIHNRKFFNRLAAQCKLFIDKSSTSSHHSLIGPDVVISGNLNSAGDIYLLGRIDGEIKCRGLFMCDESRVDEIALNTDKIYFAHNS